MESVMIFFKCFDFKIKLSLTVVLSVFTILPSFNQTLRDTFLLNGTIDGVTEGKIFLSYYVNKEEKVVNDSSFIHNGHFSFRGKVFEPTVAFLNLNRTRVIDDNTTNIFLEPAVMHVNVKLNQFNKAHLNGSNTQKEYEDLEASKQILHDRYKKEIQAFTLEKDVKKKDSLQVALTPYYAALNQKEYSFFAAHPKSYVTLYLLQYHRNELSLDSLELFYNRIPRDLKQSIIGQNIGESIKKIKGGSVGSKGKDFTTIDIKGDSLRLSNFRGKYVLLDFWASWCVPCRKGNPHLISLYNKYKTKGFEIVGVSDDDTRPALWKKAIEKDSINIWRHVLRGLDKAAVEKGKSNDNDISKMYGVGVLPTKILINPRGLIVGRYEAEDENHDLDKKLLTIFQ